MLRKASVNRSSGENEALRVSSVAAGGRFDVPHGVAVGLPDVAVDQMSAASHLRGELRDADVGTVDLLPCPRSIRCCRWAGRSPTYGERRCHRTLRSRNRFRRSLCDTTRRRNSNVLREALARGEVLHGGIARRRRRGDVRRRGRGRRTEDRLQHEDPAGNRAGAVDIRVHGEIAGAAEDAASKRRIERDGLEPRAGRRHAVERSEGRVGKGEIGREELAQGAGAGPEDAVEEEIELGGHRRRHRRAEARVERGVLAEGGQAVGGHPLAQERAHRVSRPCGREQPGRLPLVVRGAVKLPDSTAAHSSGSGMEPVSKNDSSEATS